MTDRPACRQFILVRVCLVAVGVLAITACRDDAVVGTDVPGPPCDCDSHFPMCVGVSWTYTIKDARTSAVSLKTLSIVDWDDPGRPEYGLTGFMAFRQRRVAETDTKDSWLQESSDGSRVMWLMDEWFDLDRQRTRAEYYVPAKLRVDESPEHSIVGAMWHEHFTEYNIEQMTETVIEHEVDWTTLEPQDHAGFRATFCEHKSDTLSSTSVPVDATYCFAKGVGKVWELTQLVGEENLVSWTVPGCTP